MLNRLKKWKKILKVSDRLQQIFLYENKQKQTFNLKRESKERAFQEVTPFYM